MNNENLFPKLDYGSLVCFAALWAKKLPIIQGIRLYEGRSDIPHVLVFFIDSDDCAGVPFTDLCKWCNEGCCGEGASAINKDIFDSYKPPGPLSTGQNPFPLYRDHYYPLDWVRLIEDPEDNLDDPDSLAFIKHPDRYWQLYPIQSEENQRQEKSNTLGMITADNCLRNNVHHWEITFEGHKGTVKALIGWRYLAYLISKPGISFNYQDLINIVNNQGSMSDEEKRQAIDYAGQQKETVAHRAYGTSKKTAGPNDGKVIRKLQDAYDDLRARRDEADISVRENRDKDIELFEEKCKASGYTFKEGKVFKSKYPLDAKDTEMAVKQKQSRDALTKALKAAINRIDVKSQPGLKEHFEKYIKKANGKIEYIKGITWEVVF